jgi:hypothetical protein
MASSNWKGTAEVVGIAAIVVSLVFVGVQLSLEREVSIVEARAGLTDRVINLTDIVHNNEDVWKRGLDNDELTPTEEVRFLGLYHAVRSHIFTQWVRWSRIGPVDPDAAPQSFAYALYIHPGFRRVHETVMTFRHDRQSAFDADTSASLGDFDALVDDYLQELDRLTPEPNRQYVFW